MNLRRIRPLFLLVGLLTAGVGGSPVHAQQTVMLTASEFQFVPPAITVPAGQPITFQLTNTGQFPHNLHIEGQGVVFDLVPGGVNVAPGQITTGTMTFTTAGAYNFWCPVGNHQQRGMVGTLTVTAAAGAPGSAPVQLPGALPRTGDATSAAAGVAVLGGGLLAGLGWLLRHLGRRA
jgi:LPXTG-motif cell wall-anchored protein